MFKLLELNYNQPLPNVATITIRRPEARNALNAELLGEMDLAINEIEFKKEEIRAVVITGEGRAFIAGADIAQMVKFTPVEGRHFLYSAQQTFNRLENLPMPTIAMINGFALGGGLETALACDIRICSSKAKFGLPEVNLGIIPSAGGTMRLPRLIGIGRAKRLILTGKLIDAATALDYGLVTDVGDPEELPELLNIILNEILRNGPVAVREAKRSVNNTIHERMRAGLELELDGGVACFLTSDLYEGMTAFLEKRKPNFTGK